MISLGVRPAARARIGSSRRAFSGPSGSWRRLIHSDLTAKALSRDPRGGFLRVETGLFSSRLAWAHSTLGLPVENASLLCKFRAGQGRDESANLRQQRRSLLVAALP